MFRLSCGRLSWLNLCPLYKLSYVIVFKRELKYILSTENCVEGNLMLFVWVQSIHVKKFQSVEMWTCRQLVLNSIVPWSSKVLMIYVEPAGTQLYTKQCMEYSASNYSSHCTVDTKKKKHGNVANINHSVNWILRCTNTEGWNCLHSDEARIASLV